MDQLVAGGRGPRRWRNPTASPARFVSPAASYGIFSSSAPKPLTGWRMWSLFWIAQTRAVTA
jgi:hypothetical protein